MLDLPDVQDTQFVGERTLVQRLLDELTLAPVIPWAGQLMLEEDAESHPLTVDR